MVPTMKGHPEKKKNPPAAGNQAGGKIHMKNINGARLYFLLVGNESTLHLDEIKPLKIPIEN